MDGSVYCACAAMDSKKCQAASNFKKVTGWWDVADVSSTTRDWRPLCKNHWARFTYLGRAASDLEAKKARQTFMARMLGMPEEDLANARSVVDPSGIEFPNMVPANLADVHSDTQTVSPATDLVNTSIRYVYFFVKALLALLLSSGGLILMLSLFSQFKLIRATEARLPVPKMDSPIAPIRVDMHVDPNNRIRMDAFPAALQIGKSKGNAWDSCAGHNLFPFTNCFH